MNKINLYEPRRRKSKHDFQNGIKTFCNCSLAINRWTSFYIMDNHQIVKEFITKNLKLSNGSCGIQIPMLSIQTGIAYKELKPILRELYEKGVFSLREGINGKMIFKK